MFTTDTRILDGRKQWKVILVAAIRPHETKEQVYEYVNELSFLAQTAGAKAVAKYTQSITRPDPRTFIGKGKLQQIKSYMEKHDIKVLIFDDELSGSQINNIKNICDCKVMDRTDLILEIFSKRAQTAQAKLQVELARLHYLRPRLKNMWTHLERQRGGIGHRSGPGEKEIEKDRRLLDKRIKILEDKLEKRQQQSRTQRKQRDQFARVALVGYTNAGKTTLMNRIAGEDLFAENKLFATLDTTVRRTAHKRVPYLISDTVGFIRKLPHHLVESFKTTLAEAREADILLHVVDISQPNFEENIDVVHRTLHELEADDKEIMVIFNKIDKYRNKVQQNGHPHYSENGLEDFKASWMEKMNGYETLFVSAKEKENIGKLKERIYQRVKSIYQKRYPHQAEFQD
jgi:GTP-binding protein HflX